MVNIIIIARESDKIKELANKLNRSGFSCWLYPDEEKALEQNTIKALDLLLVDIEDSDGIERFKELPALFRQQKKPMLMYLIHRIMMANIAEETTIADFIVKPYEVDELAVRVRRLIGRVKNIDTRKVIESGDLIIDTGSCEVVLGGMLVELTFKEYELLKFLISNKGRVFSRETLLNKVWKYDYLGGERTVDVHVRRLRSKIEDADHTFIDTVRNIGYRFRKDA